MFFGAKLIKELKGTIPLFGKVEIRGDFAEKSQREALSASGESESESERSSFCRKFSAIRPEQSGRL